MIVLHVGPHKTGSTYIQNCLKRSRKGLAANGWYYPDVGYLNQAHHTLAHEKEDFLYEDSRYHSKLKQLSRRKNGNYIFSAEGFVSWSVEDFKALTRTLNVADSDVHIVFVVRDPVSLFYSYWGEEVKQGYCFGLTARYARYFSDPKDHTITNPLAFLDPIREGTDFNIHLIPYEQVRSQKQDLFKCVLDTIPQDLNIEPLKKSVVNKRYPIALTEFLRLLTNLHAKGSHHVGSDLRLEFTKTLTRAERREILDTMNGIKPGIRRVLSVSRNNHHYDTLEHRLLQDYAENFSPKVQTDALFTRDTAKLVYCDDIAMMLDNKLRELLNYHYVRLQRVLS